MNTTKPCVYIVDDDDAVRDSASALFESVNIECHSFASAREFLAVYDGSQCGCLLVDIRMPEMNGMELQRSLKQAGCVMPIIFMTGHGDIPMAVETMRLGALDFLRKPVREQDLLDRVQEAFDLEAGRRKAGQHRQGALQRMASLSGREREVFERVTDGMANKVVAIELGISERTVEVHRAQVMKKLEVTTLAQLVRLRIEVERSGTP